MYSNDDLQNLSEEEKKRKRHTLQMQLIMLEGENKKLAKKQEILEAEIRQIKKEMDQARLFSDEKKEELEKISFKLEQGEEEIRRIKKKMNLL